MYGKCRKTYDIKWIPRDFPGWLSTFPQVGADMNAKDDREYTAVAHAEANNHFVLMDRLVQLGGRGHGLHQKKENDTWTENQDLDRFGEFQTGFSGSQTTMKSAWKTEKRDDISQKRPAFFTC